MAKRTRPVKKTIILPKLGPHWHPPGCGCEPAQPYVRVSKVGAREQIISPDLQLSAIEAFARRKDLILLPPVFDIDKSGRTFRKRSVDGIIRDIAAGAHRVVVLWKWSRWARNREESGIYMKKIRAVGGRVESATEDIDQSTADGQLHVGILQEFDQYQSNLIKQTFHAVHDRRRDSGLPHSGRPRFGYDYEEYRDSDGRLAKRYVPNEEAPHLVRAYRLFLAGKSFKWLANDLNDRGVTTIFAGRWTSQSLVRMMDTGFAAGLIRERSAPTDTPANSIAGYDVWRVGSHEALIDRNTWKAYKGRRLATSGLPPRARTATHALSALLFCAVCGRRLATKYVGTNKVHQWLCPWSKAHHPDRPVSVTNRLALLAVRAWVEGVIGEEVDMAALRARAEDEMGQAEREAETAREGVLTQIRSLDDKIENLLDYAESAAGRSREKINARLAGYEAEVNALNEQLATIAEVEPRRVFAEGDQVALQKLDELWEAMPPEVLRDGLSRLLSRIEVYPRTATSSTKSASDRVLPVGAWEPLGLEEWRESRSTR